MKKAFVNRIINAEGSTVKAGRYSYRLNVWTGDIIRCPSEDVGRMWITWDGRQVDAWEVVAHA